MALPQLEPDAQQAGHTAQLVYVLPSVEPVSLSLAGHLIPLRSPRKETAATSARTSYHLESAPPLQ